MTARELADAAEALPRIVRFLGTSDAGGADAFCPHCGATGRYVHTFQCEDGSTRGAMSGCIQLFPVHPIASAALRLEARQLGLRQRFGLTAKLNSWDQQIREAIDEFYAGTMDERTALYRIRCAEQAKQNYRGARIRR